MITCSHCLGEVDYTDSRYTDKNGFECVNCYLMRRAEEERWKSKGSLVIIPTSVRGEDTVTLNIKKYCNMFSYEYQLREVV